LWPILRSYSQNFPWGTVETRKHHQDSQSLSQDLNWGSDGYEAEVLSLTPQCSNRVQIYIADDVQLMKEMPQDRIFLKLIIVIYCNPLK